MGNGFDEAKNETEEMFLQQINENPEDNSSDIDNQPEQDQQAPNVQSNNQEQVISDAVNTAEVATQAVADRESQLQEANKAMQDIQAQNQQYQAQMQQMAEQMQNMQGTIDELSSINRENIIEEALEPPTLDINALAFADDETIANAQAEYMQKMSDYNRRSIMKELEPMLQDYKETKLMREKDDLINNLEGVPELKGIREMLPQLDRIIKNNNALSAESVPLDEKYITAYAIARGVNDINKVPEEPKEQTIDDLIGLYKSNPEFQDAIEKLRIEQLNNSQQVPPMSASSGAVNAALNIKEKPKTFEEASERTRRMFDA